MNISSFLFIKCTPAGDWLSRAVMSQGERDEEEDGN